VNAVPTPISADRIGDAMRLIAATISDTYGDELAELDRVDVRLAVRAALERVVSDGYGYARTLRQVGRQARYARSQELTCTVCPRLRRGRLCFDCRREAARLEALRHSRVAERDRLRFGRSW
jgi:hypothetical protein